MVTLSEEIDLLIAQISERSSQLVLAAGDVAPRIRDDRSRQLDFRAGLRIISRQTLEKAEFFENLVTTLKDPNGD